MGDIKPHDENLYAPADGFLGSIKPEDLVYFALNVGNGDTQLLVLPEQHGVRDLVVVDVATTNKLPDLIGALSTSTGVADQPALLTAESRIRLTVATHPHQDHVGGMPNFLQRCGHLLNGGGEVWDPGYFSSNTAWQSMMHWLEDNPQVGRLHPTSGTTRYLDEVVITALSPSMRLRSQFDTYGVYVNNASIALRVEFPAARVFTAEPGENEQGVGRVDRGLPDATKLILGADSQTQSWSHVEGDFPRLEPSPNPVQQALKLAVGSEPLSATLFKVPHHASKNGLNYELADRVKPSVSIVSCDPTKNSHGFPHAIAQDQLREALNPIAKCGGTYPEDHLSPLNIHYTGGTVTTGAGPIGLGSIAVVLRPTKRWTLWRLLDTDTQRIDTARLLDAWRYK